MNIKIREFLIEQCRVGKPVFYEDIAKQMSLNLSLDSDRHLLSKTLGDISAYEYEKGRPLVSSIAIYKTENDHGNGFYKLCEELGIGKSKDLKEEYYGFSQMSEAKSFWTNPINYRQFLEIKTKIYSEGQYPYFTQAEFNFFKQWANKPYDKNNSDHYTAKEYLLNTIWSKTKFCADEVVARLENFDSSTKRIWSKRGWDNGKQVSQFKPYTWARIFKKDHRNREIFFTIGYDANEQAFVYKLDYYKENDSRLTAEQKQLCEKHIPNSISWRYIEDNDFIALKWDKLISKLATFISANSHHYDELQKVVWGDSSIQELFRNHLTKREFPQNGFSSLPEYTPSFQGRDIDFIQKNIEDKELGDAGEELVKEYEIAILKENGLHELANKVSFRKIGEGYDILSFTNSGEEKYIEVKTTKGNENTPFMFTQNEKIFGEMNQAKYCIYRLYNYDEEKNTADFYIISDIHQELLFSPVEYKVYLKKRQ